jgi:hypothetical protein
MTQRQKIEKKKILVSLGGYLEETKAKKIPNPKSQIMLLHLI